MKNKFISIPLLALCLSATSCAGLISGKTQNVFLRTSDGSTDVEVEVTAAGGTQHATIPSVVVVPRGEAPLTVSVKETRCHKAGKTFIPTKYNVMLLADAIGGLFGLTGTTMDMNSGAAWAYDDNAIVNISKKPGCN